MPPNFEKTYPLDNEEKGNEKEGGTTRREFLGKSLALGVSLLDGGWAKNYMSGERSRAESERKKVNPIDEILDYDRKGRAVLDLKVARSIQEYWMEKYTHSSLRKSLEDGYREWGRWRPYTEEKFKEQGVPIKFARLALPETHWDVKAISRAGARGPYQFTRNTGEKYDLEMGKVIDDRQDPEKSSKACAKNLKDLHDEFHDWDVALSGYNGGFVWAFNTSAKQNERSTNYENYLKFIGEDITGIKNDLRRDTLTHKVRKGDTVGKISGYYGVSEREFRRVNRIKDSNIEEGQKLMIPTARLARAKKKALFAKLMRGYHENLNYAPKFRAIDTLIEGGFVKEQHPPVIFKKDRIVGAKKRILSAAEAEYEVVEKDNWYIIARKFNKRPKELIKYNIRKKRPFNLRIGDKIIIPEDKSDKEMIHVANSLESEAKKRGKSLQRIVFLNPQILDEKAALPAGTIIRV